MNKQVAFIMPVKITGSDLSIAHFVKAVESIKNQTDPDWILIMVEDFSDNKPTLDKIEEFKKDLKDKLHVIYNDRNYGTGKARNIGLEYAHKIGVHFVLYLDSDDLCDPRRLELVRKEFDRDPNVNVVYTSFDVIDEYDNLVPEEEISMSIREITDGHKHEPVEGELAWIQITSKKKYTNLTSCTAVKTDLAYEEQFPSTNVSEDCHTWMRYGAHPGKFVFIKEIKGGYRICTGTASRSRVENKDFYGQMMRVDTDGFEQALLVAKKYGTTGGYKDDELRCAFQVRLALGLVHGGAVPYAKLAIDKALNISKEMTINYINKLYCQEQYRNVLLDMAK